MVLASSNWKAEGSDSYSKCLRSLFWILWRRAVCRTTLVIFGYNSSHSVLDHIEEVASQRFCHVPFTSEVRYQSWIISVPVAKLENKTSVSVKAMLIADV